MLLGVALIFGAGVQAAYANDDTRIDLSFDQVDVRALIALMGELTGRRFVVSEDVQGSVTVMAPGVPRAQAYSVLLSILTSAGCTVVPDGELYRVVKLPEGSFALGPLSVSRPGDEPGLQTRVFRLEHASAEDVRKLLESLGGQRTRMGVVEASNHLVVTDTSDVLERLALLVDELDQPGAARMADVIELNFADALQTARQLTEALSEAQTRAAQLLGRLPRTSESSILDGRVSPPSIVAAPHANRLIVVGTPRQLENLRSLVARMDVDVPSGRSRLNAIFLRYINAEAAADNLNNLIERSVARGGEGGETRRIAVEANVANNALLVDALPQDFELVRRLVEQLDIKPEQVHISVLIVEVADSDSFTLGAEFTALSLPGDVGDIAVSGGTRIGTGPTGGERGMLDALQSGLFPQGVTVGVGRGMRLDGAGNLVVGYPAILTLNALRESGKVEILSETSLEAQNNHEATVSVVDEIPVLKSTIAGGTGTARDVIQNIERMEVGVKLRMIPQIIPGGLVRVKLEPSIEAVTSAGGSDDLTPTIAKRSVSTTVTVSDGETIVIAGLTRRDVRRLRRRVPVLGAIPILGWLFRYDVDRDSRTNLLIFVTPRVVSTSEDARGIADAWREKTGINAGERPIDQP